MNEPTKEQKGSSSTLSHDEPAGASATDIRQAAAAVSIPQHESTDDKKLDEGTDTRKLRRLDYGFLPIPRSRRYDPANAQSPHYLNYLFAFASTTTVANLYYCQPLLVQYSESFGVSYGQVTHVPTVLQAGYAGGLLLLTPLGDLIRRRQFILLLIFVTTMLSIGLAVTRSFTAFLAINFFVGFFTVTPQVLIPLAADLSPPNRRAQSMAIVLSGLLLGILYARVVAGVIAEYVSWRNVYYMAIGTQGLVAISLYFALPDYPPKNPDLKYWQVFPTMIKFICTNPVLVQGSITSGIGSANFISFWVTLTFLLSENPYNYSTLTIGLFGLVGIVAVCTAPFCGKLVDRLVPWVGVVVGNCLLLVANVLLIVGARASIAVIVIAILFQDIGQQLQQVSNQSRIFSTNPAAGSRMNAVYILGIFVGQLIGSSVCSKVFLDSGPRPFYGLSLGLIGLNLLILMARGPLKSNTKWLGWGKKDEWAVVKRKERKPDPEQPKVEEVESKGDNTDNPAEPVEK